MAEDEAIDPIRPVPDGKGQKDHETFDKDINKVNSEALILVSCSTDIFSPIPRRKIGRSCHREEKKTEKFGQAIWLVSTKIERNQNVFH